MSTGISKSPLGQLVKEIKGNYTIQDPSKEELLVIDSSNNISRGEPKRRSVFKSYRSFVIYTGKTINFEGYLCTITGKHGPLRIIAAYTLACEHSDLETLILNISDDQQATVLPNSIIQAEMERIAANNGLADDFYKSQKATEQSIIQKLKGFGITARSFEIQMDGYIERLQPQEINNDSLRIGLPGNQPKITIGIKLKIRIQKGKETKFLASNSTNDLVEVKIFEIISDYFNNDIASGSQADGFSSTVSNAIESKIDTYLDSIGREIEAFTLSFPENTAVEAIKLESTEYIDVRLSDSRQMFRLKYKCELLVNTDYQANLFLYPVSETTLHRTVENQLKKSLSQSIETITFLDKLNTEVAGQLAEAIDKKIIQWGRTVNYLQLELDTSRTPPRFLEVNHNVNCKSQDGHEVVVNNTLMLQRDFSVNKAFEAYQISDFSNWARAELERITKSHIINQTYNQLLYDFKDFKLKEEFKTEADKIGYLVNHLIILPQFDPTKKSERFRIDYNNLNLNSKIDGIQLAVSVNAEGRISSYKKIMSLLAPKESIELSMEKYIGGKINQFFNTVDPDRFYLRFNSMDTHAGDQITLENEIRELVIKALIEEYDAEIRSVSVKQLDTPLINRFKQLREGIFECFFQDKTGFFKYKARIDVLNVDPEKWSVFNSKGYRPRNEDPNDTERNDIRNYISEYVENGLNTDLLYKVKDRALTSIEDFIEGIRRLLDEVTVEIRDMFGLNIRIYKPLKLDPEGNPNKTRLDFQVYETETELEMRKKMYDLALKEKMTRLQELYNQRRENASLFSNAPELKKINEEIKEIENTLKPDEGPLQLEDPFS
jgi:hypothetical protein